jgi:hypothetical protein
MNPQKPPKKTSAANKPAVLSAADTERLRSEIEEMQISYGYLALITAFPRIFRERSSALAALNHPPGWHKLMHALLEQVNALLDDRQVEGFGLLLTKSKFAGLRLHWMLVVPEGASDATLALWDRHAEEDEQTRALIRQAVQSACKQSAQTCERCASTGALRNFDGFLATLCTPCAVRAQL